MNFTKKQMTVAIAIALACGPAYAVSYTWTGSGNGSTLNKWSAVQNWGGSGVPGANDTAAINGGPNTPTLDTNISIAALNYTGVASGGNLNLSGKTLTIRSDYNSSFFGLGNSFNRYANVNVNGGAINAYSAGGTYQPSGFQGLSVDGGTTKTHLNAILNMGNTHVGQSVTKSYQIFNMAGAGGVASNVILRGAIQGSGLNSQLTGAGVDVTNSSWTATAAASPAGVSKSVTFTGTTAGALSGQQVTILNNFANTNSQTLSIVGGVYRYATANTITSQVNLGNVHVGGTFGTSKLSVSNTAVNDSWSDWLDARISDRTGKASAYGSVTGLRGGYTNNTSMEVGLSGSYHTGTAGAKTGTVVVGLQSNGTYGGLGYTSLASQTITVNGGVYRLATANTITTPVNLGIIHVGDSFGTQAVNITNTVTNDAYSEKLNASIGGGSASGTGSISQLAAGSSSSALSVGLGNADTSTAGAKTGTVAISLVSDGTGTSGLGTTALASQNVTVEGQVNNYAQAAFTSYSGNGSLSGSGTDYVINLGSILQGTGTASGSFYLANIGGLASYTDLMDGAFNTSGISNFTLTGFNNFQNLTGGSSLSSLMISLDNSTAGTFNQDVTLSWNGHNANYLGGENTITLHLTGTVSSVPVPTAAWLLGSGLLGLIGMARRKVA